MLVKRGLLVALMLMGGLRADAVLGADTLTIYPPTSKGDSAAARASSFFRKYNASPAAIRDSFTVKALVSLATEGRRSAYDIKELTWNPSATAPRTPSARREAEAGAEPGWNRVDQSFVWTPGAGVENLTIPFGSEQAAAGGLSLTDYDELWVDYHELSPAQPCLMSVKLALDLKDYDGGAATPLTATTGENISQVVESIDASTADWVTKDNAYVLGRMFRRTPDAKWRYTMWNGLTVVQRRLHRDLSDISAVDLVFSSRFEVEGLSLRIATADNYGPGDIVELQKTPEVTTEPSGDMVWHVNIQRILAGQFAGKKKDYLQEIIVFIKSSEADAAQFRPLRKVILKKVSFRDTELARKGELVLPLEVKTVTPSLKRMVVDLSMLKRNGYPFLRSGRLSIMPGNASGASAVAIEKIRLSSLYDLNLPAFLHSGETLSRKWGGPFINPADLEQGVEWPEVAGYLNFGIPGAKPDKAESVSGDDAPGPSGDGGRASVDGTDAHSGPTEFFSQNFTVRAPGAQNEVNRNAARQDGYADTHNGLFIENNVVLRSDTPLARAVPGDRGLVLQGSGSWVDVSWPISAPVDKGAVLFLAVPEGAKQVQKIEVTAAFLSGVDRRLLIIPNKPAMIPWKGTLKRLDFRIYVIGAPFRVRLGEVALFRPRSISMEEAFIQKLPSTVERDLIPVALRASRGVFAHENDGLLDGIALADQRGVPSSPALRWSTPLTNSIESVGGVRLRYHIPNETLSANPCWLNLTLHWDNGSESKDVCLEQPVGDVLIPVADFLGKGGSRRGVLRSVDWKVDFGAQVDEGDRGFEFKAAYVGFAMESAYDEFGKWPVLFANGSPLGFSSDEMTRKQVLQAPVRLEAAAGALSKIAAAGGSVEPVESPWFKIDSVEIWPTPSLPEITWKSFIETKSAAPGSRFSRLLRAAVFLAFVCLLWKSVGIALAGEFGTQHPAVRRMLTSPILWAAAAFLLYGAGIRHKPDIGENYCFTLGALTAALTMGFWLRSSGPIIGKYFPGASELIVNGAGAPYFACAALALLGVAGGLAFQMHLLAEQLTIIVYFALLIGTFREGVELFKKRQ